MRKELCYLAVLLAGGCTAPVPAADVRDADNDAAAVDVADNDAPEFDAAVNDVPDPPVDIPNGTDVPDRDVPNRDVPNFDVPNRDVPNPRPCQLDPFNCGMCGRVCGGPNPACAQVSNSVWGCVNNCEGFGGGCTTSDGGTICCPGFACGPQGVGCR